jgi:hypothetical protein
LPDNNQFAKSNRLGFPSHNSMSSARPKIPTGIEPVPLPCQGSPEHEFSRRKTEHERDWNKTLFTVDGTIRGASKSCKARTSRRH